MTSWKLSALKILGLLAFACVLAVLFTERADAISKLGIVVGALGVTAVMMVRPHLGILVIVAVWFTDFEPSGVRFLSIPYLVTACLVIPLAVALIQDRGVWVLSVPQIHILVAVALLFVAGTWWSWLIYPVTPFPPLDETARFFQVFAGRFVFLILFLYFIRTPARMSAVVWLMVALITMAAVDAFIGFETGEVKRASASFGLARNSNRLGFICLFALSFVWFYRRYGTNQRIKTITLPLLFLLPVSVAATASRSAFLEMLLLAGLMVKDRGGWSGSKRSSALALLVAVALAVAVLVPTATVLRATTYDPSLHAPGQQSLKNRIRRVEAAVDVIVSNPLLGVGLGNFRWFYRTFYGLGGDPHNSYLWVAASGGLGALALYLLLFYVTYRMLARLERSGSWELLWLTKATKANLLLFLVFSAFADFWLSEFLYLIVGLTIAMSYLDRRRANGPLAHPGGVPSVVHA